jgi:hypothetical protein
MNLEDYKIAWQTEQAAAPLRSELETMIGSMIRSDRRSRIVFRICAANTVLVFPFTVSVLTWLGPVPWKEVVPLLLLQLMLALGLFVLMSRRKSRERALQAAVSTVQEAARLGLDDIESEERDTRLLLVLAGLAVPFLAYAVYQLVLSGKMNGQAAASFATLCAAVLGINIAVKWWRRQSKLKPRRQRLEQLLASFGEGG